MFDLKRINLFIGRPNTGISNIMEALSIFSIPALTKNENKLSNVIRLNTAAELFYNMNCSEPAIISTNASKCTLDYISSQELKMTLLILPNFFEYTVSEDLVISERNYVSTDNQSPVKKYVYKEDVTYKKENAVSLNAPFGQNLPDILAKHYGLMGEVARLFKNCGLEMTVDPIESALKIIQRGDVKIPYSSSSQTLQRMTFYKSAIESNKDSILLFEDPDAHAFPSYLVHFTQDIIYNLSNQYFISTRSPFVLNDFLENSMDDLAVFVVYQKEMETKVRRLSEEQLHEMVQYGIDIFINNELFTG